MRLKRLIIQGFKSFKDRTIVNFDDGITGIVGPNGCGKSNIVDALFWIMGEMSAKHLRGNSMKDLIFSGSSKYSPSNWAEATLVLENTEGKHIHIQNKVSSPSEIQLTRKLYRNGETEYRINGSPCRLKDIQEVFMDTGAGAKSYSIIAQGEINRLVQAKPEERRVMIEEVAGITKFKIRKRDSLKKIEATQQNLARLSDLQIEIEKNLKSLQKQAEKAERARTLKEKIKRNDLVVSSHKVYDLLKNYRDIKNSFNEGVINLENWKAQKEGLELSLEDERLQKDILTTKLDELQSEYNDESRKLAAAEERLNYLCENQTQKEKLIDEKNAEIAELIEDIEERKLKLVEIENSKESLVLSQSEDRNYDDIEEKISSMKEELEDKNVRLLDLDSEVSGLKDQIQDKSQEVFKNTSKLEEYATSLQDINLEIENLEKQFSGVSSEITDERDLVNSLEKQVADLSSELDLKQHSLSEKNASYKLESKKLDALTKEQIQLESRRDSLIEIKKSLEGAKNGISDFLSSEHGNGFALLGDKVQCDEKYVKSIQTLFNDALESLISKSEDSKELLSWLKDTENKSLDYLITDEHSKIENSEETIERLKLLGLDEITSALDIISLEDVDKARFVPMLKGFYIVENLTAEHLKSLNSGIQFRGVVSLDGKVCIKNLGGALSLRISGDEDTVNSAIARNNKIKELTSELEDINYSIEKLEKENLENLEIIENETLALEESRENYLNLKESFVSKKSALESKVAGFESSHSRLEILTNRKTEISKSRMTLLEQEDKLSSDVEELQEKLDVFLEEQETLKEEKQIFQDSYESERDEFLKLKAEADSFNDRLKNFDSQIEDIKKQLDKNNSKLESSKDQVQNYENEIESIENELKGLEQSNLENADALKDKEENLSLQKDQLVSLLTKMQEREDEVKELGKLSSKLEKEMVEYEMKLGQFLQDEEQVVRDSFEKYQIDLRKCLGQFLEYTEDEASELNDLSTMYFIETENGQKEIEQNSYEFHRRYGQDLKDCSHKLKNYKNEYNRLGEINWQAVEDYDRQKMRFDFLNTQEKELKKSLEDLQLAIDQIDNKSKTRFKIAFEEVNERFKKVFPIIFGGGNASLKVMGDLDSSDCGVDIIAQPPGKKMQNINLMSGGEKALTAVSLIFSIFLVKPSPFCLLDEVDAPLDDANVGRFNELLREMSKDSQFILITHNKKTMELNDTLYGVTMQEPGISKAVSVQLH